MINAGGRGEGQLDGAKKAAGDAPEDVVLVRKEKMKNRSGMSTSSPASSFCSSKQKHSTLAKYGAIYIIEGRKSQ